MAAAGGRETAGTESGVQADSSAALLATVLAMIAEQGAVTVGTYRDRFQTSRKYALALLEHLDQARVTRRVGDERVLY